MLKVFVHANLWDIVDGGVDATLDRIQGLGAAGVCLQVTSGPVAQLRTLPDVKRRIFRSRGGFFFHPTPEQYHDTHLQPITATWLTRRNPLEKIAGGCRARDLILRLRISAFEVGRITARHPEVASTTVFDDVAPVTMCPANPEVRALLRGTVMDLAQNFEPEAIELVDVRYHSGASVSGELNIATNVIATNATATTCPTFLSLLGICFSPSSRQSAIEHDIDAAAAARSTQLRLEKILKTGHVLEEPIAKLLAADEILEAYIQHQRDILKNLVESLHAAVSPEILPVVPAHHTNAVPPYAGDSTTPCVLITNLDDKDDKDDKDAASPSPIPATALEIDPTNDLATKPQCVVSAVSNAAQRGIRTIVLRSLAHWPPNHDDVIRQAIRYAKRTTE